MFLSENFAASATLEDLLRVAGSLSLRSVEGHQTLKPLFEKNALVWEGYTIGEHTLMVMRAGHLLPGEPTLAGFSKHDESQTNFQHDAGKALGTRENQSVNNLRVLLDLHTSGQLGLETKLYRLYEFLIGEDISIYKELFGKAYKKRPKMYCPNPNDHPFGSAELRQDPGYELATPLPAEVILDYVGQLQVNPPCADAIASFVAKVKSAAADLKVNPVHLLELLVRRFQADTLAYTNHIKGAQNLHGLVSLDYVYAWEKRSGENFVRPVVNPNGRRFTFAPGLEEIFCQAEERIAS